MSIDTKKQRKEHAKKENYSSDIIKMVSKKLSSLYPDIDEDEISNNHKNSNSSRKLKTVLKNMISTGEVKLETFQYQLIKSIISKRTHTYHYNKSKAERKEYFDSLDITGLSKEIIKVKDGSNGPKNKWDKSWSFGFDNITKDYVISMEKTREEIKEIFRISDESKLKPVSVNSIVHIDSTETQIEEEFHFTDLRQEKWIKIKTDKGICQFISKNKLDGIVNILRNIFRGNNINEIIIDICRELLIQYKDRVKAYSIIIDRYI